MRIRTLEVEAWRGLSGPVQLELGDGVNLIAGPNEAGKSSVREALRFAFTMPPKARKKDLLAVRPWETSLFPRVAVDFDLGGHQWKVEKEFFRTRNLAEIHKDGRVIAKDDQVQAVLDDALQAAGAWVDVLWGRQGDVGFVVDDADALRSRLATAAREAVTPGIGWLEERLQRENDKYWTPTGRPKKSLQDLADEVTAAEGRLRQARQRLAESDTRSEAAAGFTAEVARLQAAEAALQARLEAARHALGAWTAWRSAAAEVEAATEKRRATEGWLGRVRRLADEIVRLWPQAADHTARVAASEASLGERPGRDEVEALQAEAGWLQAALRRSLAEALEALRVPPAADMKRLEALEAAIGGIEGALNMGAVQASLTAFKTLEPILERDGDEAESFTVPAGEKAEWDADVSFAVEIPGVAKIEVKSGNADVQKQLGELSSMEEERAALLSRWGLATVAEARERAQHAAVLQARLGPAPVEAPGAPPCAVPPTDDAREQRLQALPALIAAAEQAAREGQVAWERRSQEHQALLRENPRARLALHVDQLRDAVAEAPPGAAPPVVPHAPDEAWVAALPTLWDPWVSLRDAQEQAVATLLEKAARPPGDEVGPATLRALEVELEGLRAQQAAVRSQLDQTLGALQAQGALYAAAAADEEALERAVERQQRARHEAGSVRLLLEALGEAKNDLQRDVVAPLQARVGERLAGLTGGRYRGVEVGTAFDLGAVVPAQVSRAAVDDLSFGTREQLVFLTRLCLAEMLGESGEAQVVVFDDNLVHTDAERMRSACRLLAEAGRHLQILVFTCHPERYSFTPEEARMLHIPTREG